MWKKFYTDPSILNDAELVDTYLASDTQGFSDGLNWVTPGADQTVHLTHHTELPNLDNHC
jgi:hypothetical protein